MEKSMTLWKVQSSKKIIIIIIMKNLFWAKEQDKELTWKNGFISLQRKQEAKRSDFFVSESVSECVTSFWGHRLS